MNDTLTNPEIKSDPGKATGEDVGPSLPPRPQALKPHFDIIPAELRAMVRWVVWRYEWVQKKGRPGRWTKIPYNARTGRKARSNNPRDCHSFEQARAAYQAGGYDGVGIVHLHSDNVTGVDGDHCRDPHSGIIDEAIRCKIALLDTYTEVSPSGKGVRAFAWGKKPGRRCSKRKIAIELYDGLTKEGTQGGRFLTVTGHQLEEFPATLNQRQEQIDQIYGELFGAVAGEQEKDDEQEDDVQEDHEYENDVPLTEAGKAYFDAAGEIPEENQRAQIEFERLVHVCLSAKYPERSRADFAVIIFAIENGLPQEYVYSRIKHADKIVERGRSYFETTWKSAADKVHATMNGKTPRTPTFDINRTIPAGQAPARQAPARQAPASQADDDIDQVHLTDTGNGKRFVRDHGAIVRFCFLWGKWLIWDGKRWRIDNVGRVMALAKTTILGLYRWAEKKIKALPADDSPETKIAVAKIKAVLDFALKSQHVNRLKAMLELAKSEQGVPILPEQLDSNIWLFNCPNGTLDLRTGKLKAHDQNDYLTKLCPTRYVPTALWPIWKKIIDSIFNGDVNLIECVRRFLGYALTGDTREQALPIAIGKGANGKTLLLRMVLNVMGLDYAGIAPAELLTETKGDQHPTIKATLFGKRLMIAFETAQDARLNEARIKTLTGEDGVTARRMKEDFWEFVATHKIILCTNHRPQIKGQDHGIWRRLAIWPFTQTYWDADKGETGPPHLKADKTLKDKLQAEHEGILAWLVQGCIDWQQQGIVLPDVVHSATNEYRTTEDKLGTFIAERCVIGAELRVKASVLWGEFQSWSLKKRENPGTGTAFGIAMGERGFNKDAGKRWYLGIDLCSPATDEEAGEPQT